MTDFEIRRIGRAIGNGTTGIVPFENNNKETDNAMIAEVDHAAIARAQEYWGDVQDGHTVQQAKTPGQQQLDKQRLAHQDRLDAGRTAYALQCRYEFDPIACAEQFSRECI